MHKPKPIFVVFGKSHTGKTAVVTALVNKYGVRRIHNTTTRPQRSKDDTEYNFVDEKAFLQDWKAGRYIAVRTYLGVHDEVYYYGVDKLELEKGGLIITDFLGFQVLLERGLPVVGIYLRADYETRLQRARNRPGFVMKEFAIRCANDELQFDEKEIASMVYDYPIYQLDNGEETDMKNLLETLSFILTNHM